MPVQLPGQAGPGCEHALHVTLEGSMISRLLSGISRTTPAVQSHNKLRWGPTAELVANPFVPCSLGEIIDRGSLSPRGPGFNPREATVGNGAGNRVYPPVTMSDGEAGFVAILSTSAAERLSVHRV